VLAWGGALKGGGGLGPGGQGWGGAGTCCRAARAQRNSEEQHIGSHVSQIKGSNLDDFILNSILNSKKA